MKRISSRRTPFLNKGTPAIILLALFVVFFFLFTDKHKISDVTPLFLGIIMFFLVWLVNGKGLKVVYVEKDGFIVNGKKILFENVVSIKRQWRTTHYRVRYQDGVKTTSFKFTITMFFMEPSYIKNIRRIIEERSTVKSQ
jgi:hypothetical protein